MTENTENTYYVELVKKLRKFEEHSKALIDSGLEVPETQTVLFPIPSILTTGEEKDEATCRFISTVGLVNREGTLGLPVTITTGVPMELTDGRVTPMIDVVFYYSSVTDVDAVAKFLHVTEE